MCIHRMGYSICMVKKGTHIKINGGFTIIEILVVFSIIAILGGMSLASFAAYTKRQLITQTASEIKLSIERAKYNTISQVKPVSCEGFRGYKFVNCRNASAQCQSSAYDFELERVCGSGAPVVVEGKKLPARVSLSPVATGTYCGEIFYTNGSDAFSGVPCKMQLSANGLTLIITVDSAGQISY